MSEEDPELIPEILPVDSRLVVSGSVSDFIDVLSRVSRVIPSKEVIPGTAHVLLEAKARSASTAGHVRTTASDGVNTLSAVFSDNLQVRVAGKALIPGTKFISILKLAPTDSFGLQVLGNEAIIRSGQAQWRVQLVPGSSLPDLPPVDALQRVEIERLPFLEALEGSVRAASHAAARSSLMQVKVDEGSITGMDGNRIHRCSYSDDCPLEVSIPVGTCQELIRMLKASDDSHLGAGSDGKHMVFAIGKDFLISSSLLVEFPDVDPLLIRAGMNVKHRLSIERDPLRAAITRVRVNADPDYSSIFLLISRGSEGEWGVSVRAQDRQRNSALETVPATWNGPQEVRDFCVNHRNLTDLLDSYEESTVVFQVGDDTQSVKSPLLVEDDGKFIGLIQQMRSDYLD